MSLDAFLNLWSKGVVYSLSKALSVCTALWCLHCTHAGDTCTGPHAHVMQYLTLFLFLMMATNIHRVIQHTRTAATDEKQGIVLGCSIHTATIQWVQKVVQSSIHFFKLSRL